MFILLPHGPAPLSPACATPQCRPSVPRHTPLPDSLSPALLQCHGEVALTSLFPLCARNVCVHVCGPPKRTNGVKAIMRPLRPAYIRASRATRIIYWLSSVPCSLCTSFLPFLGPVSAIHHNFAPPPPPLQLHGSYLRPYRLHTRAMRKMFIN